MASQNKIIIVKEQSLKDKIHVIRGQQVMLDFDLAETYGYSTSAFNQQVNRNIEKFDEDFMFRLSESEFENLMSQNVISSWGGRRKLPRAFNEQGIYMLMTVLKGDLAARQSKVLIRIFKSMKDYIIDNPQLMITPRDYMVLTQKLECNTDDIRKIKSTLDNVVTKADLSDFMKLFDSGIEHEEILILNGEPFKADMAYQKIYRCAKSRIIIVDDYIGMKTLQHLVHAKQNVKITIISDNKARPPLRQAEYDDFCAENPGYDITFLKTEKKAHDRYVILDNGTKSMNVYHCGASSKDAGKKITTITQIQDNSSYTDMIKELLLNPVLILR